MPESDADNVNKEVFCYACGQIHGVKALDEVLWDLYYRLKSGVQNGEPLVFTSDWMQENIHDEEDHEAMMHVMERDMVNRGLCPQCSRPNLRGKKEDDFHSPEDIEEMQDMWAMEAAERRAGC